MRELLKSPPILPSDIALQNVRFFSMCSYNNWRNLPDISDGQTSLSVGISESKKPQPLFRRIRDSLPGPKMQSPQSGFVRKGVEAWPS